MKRTTRILFLCFCLCSFGFCKEFIDARFPAALSDLGKFDVSCTKDLKDTIKNFYSDYYAAFVKNRFKCSDDFRIFDAVNARSRLQDLINDFNSRCASMKWEKIVASYDCLSEREIEEIAKKEQAGKLENSRTKR